MKVGGIVALVAVVAIGSSVALFSCGSDDNDSGGGDESANTEGKDVTQPFTLAITGAGIDFPAGALAAGESAELTVGTAPAEFTAEGVTGASIVASVTATKVDGSALNQAAGALSITVDITDAAALADVEKTTKNLCVLHKGSDGTLRKYLNSTLTIDEAAKTIKFPAIWFGTFQALYCGENFADVPAVNQTGTEVVKKAAVTIDPPCNTLLNTATKIFATGDKTAATPTGTGGTIANGTYFMTKVELFKDSPLVAAESTYFQETLVMEDGVAQTVGNSFGKDGETVHAAYTLEPAGTDPQMKQVCTSIADDAITYASYTATATSLTLYTTQYSMGVTYTLQP